MISSKHTCDDFFRWALAALCSTLLAACSFGSQQIPVKLAPVEQCVPDGALIVSFLDIGQGSSTLVRCPDGQTQALIDAGNSDKNYLKAETLFENAFFQRMGSDKTLELAVATHQDVDHIYGFLALLQRVSASEFSIGTFLDNGTDHLDHSIDNEIWKLVQATNVKRLDVVATDTRTIQICPEVPGQSPEVTMELVYPRGADRTAMNCERNYNDCSVATRFSFAGKSVYLAADQSLDSERALTDATLQALDSDIILSGHHGNTSTSERFLRAVSPRLAVLSTGVADAAQTTWWSFPEKSVVRRIKWALPRVEHAEPIEERELRAAARDEGWETLSVPPNLLSTALDGTIDVYLSSGGVCIARERFEGQAGSSRHLQFSW